MPHLDSEKKKLIAPKLNSLKPKRTETKKNSRSILNQSLMVSSRVKNQEKYPLLRLCTISKRHTVSNLENHARWKFSSFEPILWTLINWVLKLNHIYRVGFWNLYCNSPGAKIFPFSYFENPWLEYDKVIQ